MDKGMTTKIVRRKNKRRASLGGQVKHSRQQESKCSQEPITDTRCDSHRKMADTRSLIRSWNDKLFILHIRQIHRIRSKEGKREARTFRWLVDLWLDMYCS
ncbi:hypothetical protein L798_05966 [Zootermopsis nevadensis]|uniref:Uncharacterized protein n=1 Tax=Zootermopsis nevadensis TaxID=136037 RepID=A0A067R8Q5_ZOONE|nr:hypothetical protein L798_05966 [Zootermopsis nevadensis]